MVQPRNGNMRTRFTVQDDIALLREVRNLNPLRDPVQWNALAENLSHFTGRAFTARAVKERCDRLMSQHLSEDRANLRKSGTEEEYDEKAQLLGELVELAKECNYRIRPVQRRARPDPPAAASAPVRSSGTQRAAADIRDAAAAAIDLWADSPAGTQDSSPVDDSGPASVLLESLISQSDPNETEDMPQSSAPPTVGANECHRGPDDCVTLAAVPPTPPTRMDPLRAKRRQDAADMEFLEKRMKHEMAMKEKEFELETRRLALEENKLQLEREKLMNDRADKENQRKQLQSQQDSFMHFMEALIEKMSK